MAGSVCSVRVKRILWFGSWAGPDVSCIHLNKGKCKRCVVFWGKQVSSETFLTGSVEVKRPWLVVLSLFWTKWRLQHLFGLGWGCRPDVRFIHHSLWITPQQKCKQIPRPCFFFLSLVLCLSNQPRQMLAVTNTGTHPQLHVPLRAVNMAGSSAEQKKAPTRGLPRILLWINLNIPR